MAKSKKSKKSAAKLKTLIAFVLDETGSMTTIASEVLTGTNKFLSEQATLPGQADITLVKFDSANPENVVWERTRITEDLKLTDFRPGSTTPLYDAIGRTVKRVEEYEAEYDNHVLVVFTDGFENASREYTLANIKARIEQKVLNGWQTIFLGANQDAWDTGNTMGFGSTVTLDPNAASVGATYAAVSNMTSMYRGAGGQSFSHHVDTRTGTPTRRDTDDKTSKS